MIKLLSLSYLAILFLGFSCGNENTFGQEVPFVSGRSAGVELRGFEFSGAARVEGGFLICDDELVGTVVFVPYPQVDNKEGLKCSLTKIERKRKQSKPFTPLARLPVLQDIEAVASDGKVKVYVAGSHSPKENERRTDREMILEAEWEWVEEKGIRELVWKREYLNLIDDLADPVKDQVDVDLGVTERNVHPLLNLEGLACRGEDIYIGLRGPLTSDRQAVLCRTSVKEMFDVTKRKLYTVKALDLEGGGIRSLEWDSEADRLLILSGAVLDKGDVKPYLWSYNPETGQLSKLYRFSEETLSKGSPEGITRSPDGALMIVFDSDTASRGDILFIESKREEDK